MSSAQLWQYLQLIRLPNLFTVPANILVGYFAVKQEIGFQLPGLVAASLLLYVSGIVLNDYFDFERDRKTRPGRPLPSGRIPLGRAALIGISAIAGANILAFVAAGTAALGLSAAISCISVAYNYRAKQSRFGGPLLMSCARSLNILLGSSPGIAVLISGDFTNSGEQIVLAASVAMFVYIAGIMALSRHEEEGSSRTRRLGVSVAVLSLLALVGALGVAAGWDAWFAALLAVLAGALVYTFSKYRDPTAQAVQKIIRNMVLCIIIMDSVFLTAAIGVAGSAVVLLLVPAVVAGRRMYVT